MAVELSVLIVNWNAGAWLRPCLQALESRAGASFEAIVVDNASSDDSLAILRGGFPWVTLVEAGANLGFAAGANLAAQRAQGDELLLLNPDAILGEGTIPLMRSHLASIPRVGVVGAGLFDPDGQPQGGATGSFPSPIAALSYALGLGRLVPALPRLYQGEISEAREMDWVSGACCLVRRQVWEEMGGLDDGFFLYLEDVDFCRRARQRGWRVAFLPQARVIHGLGHSLLQAPHSLARQRAGYARYFAKHGGGPTWALMAALAGGFWLRLGWHAARFAVTRRPEHRQRVRLAWRALRALG